MTLESRFYVVPEQQVMRITKEKLMGIVETMQTANK